MSATTWNARVDGERRNYIEEVGPNGITRYVATVGSAFDDQARADARLIAAAPELLEALEPFADTACSLWNNRSCEPEWTEKCPGCAARAAIARAKGESK